MSRVALAADVPPVIFSLEVKFAVEIVGTKVSGVVGLTTVAVTPEVAPVIISPFTNVPLTPVSVHCGITGLLPDSESYTASNL